AMQVPPVCPDIVPSLVFVGAFFGSCPILNSTRRPPGAAASVTTVGTTYASLPFFLPSHHERTSGIRIPHAGFGQITVRAQIHAITVASVVFPVGLPSPPSTGTCALGYR